MDTRTLLIPEKTDIELEALLAIWSEQKGPVKRLGKFWVKLDELEKQKIAIYGNQAFAFVLEQIYEVKLISPDDTLVARLDHRWVKREIKIAVPDDIKEEDFPLFIKPAVPKLFMAGIFEDKAHFRDAAKGLTAHDELLVSEIISDFEAEARSFVLQGAVLDIALYEGQAELRTGLAFLNDFLEANAKTLPPTVVVDLAYSKSRGWCILEFNACWGAGLNGCDAGRVMEAIANATLNKND